MDTYDLVLGLPHTDHRGLAERRLLMHAGHFQWASIASAIGRPLSALRTMSGGEVYATFYFLEEHFPEAAPIDGFGLDHHLTFCVFLRAFKNIAIEGQVIFDHADRIASTLAGGPDRPGPDAMARHPYLRLANIFITPEAGNRRLRVAPPANADFSRLPPLPNEENPYHLTEAAEPTGRLGVLFMDAAERAALTGNCGRTFAPAEVAGRVVERRRIAYYGNVDVTDAVRTDVSLFLRPDDPRRVGIRHVIRRDGDDRLICLSEVVKTLPSAPAA